MNPNVNIYIGDLKLVREKINRYSTEEIAHIENVLKGEKRNRTHRKLRRIEETYISEVETLSEEEKNLESTERFELQKESQEIIKEEEKLEAGVNVSVSYGPVKLESNLGYSNTSSQESSNKSASKYAREITQKASSKIQEKIRTERIRKTIEEFEEINEHGIDNTHEGATNTIGIYQWVNKYYDTSLINYGKRLMIDIMVPEPAAYLIKALANNPVNSDLNAVKPADFNIKPQDISISNYQSYAKQYDATGIPVPPRKYVSVATDFTFDDMGGSHHVEAASRMIEIPEDYKAKSAYALTSWTWGWDKGRSRFDLQIGDRLFVYSFGNTSKYRFFDLSYHLETKIPITISCRHRRGVGIGVSILCERTQGAMKKWQAAVHQLIYEAYQKKLLAYQDAMAAAAYEEEAQYEALGRNPLQNRQIEKTELKKACIHILRRQPAGDFDNMGLDADGLPVCILNDLYEHGKEVKFFEQAIDWENMTYKFYPYYWAERERWVEILQLDDSDPVHLQFLQAGFARVVVPVRLGFEGAVLSHHSTGNIPGPDENPNISIPDLPIWEEIKDYPGDTPEAGEVEKEWETLVPTSLIKLKDNGEFPVFE